MAVIGALALIFFGPEQLPRVARQVGRVVRDVQNTSHSFIREMERAADDLDSREAPKPAEAEPAPEPEQR
jgi:sec-independent protein translocase protein TatA